MTISEIKLSSILAPALRHVHADVRDGAHTHYWLSGGRGSTKSSFVGIQLPLGIMRDASKGNLTHAIVLRRFAVTLRESVYAQLIWGIHALGSDALWQINIAPLSLVYIPTGQKILFRGADDPMKLKSLKVNSGYIKYGWYEEVNEFESEEKVRTINQSILRGGNDFTFFYSFNPPQSIKNWCNQFVTIPHPDTLISHSTYLTVPPHWLGPQFIAEAKHLKKIKPSAYAHEYLGEAIGSAGEVFDNLSLSSISDEQINQFDHIRRGLDWGYTTDPLTYNEVHYDSTRKKLFLFRELHQTRLSNYKAAELIRPWAGNGRIVCDSAEPKSIAEMREYGLHVIGAKKGPDSVAYGIKWLQDLEQIIIDPARCPQTAREFSGYELARDRDGLFSAGFPDHDNHHIDSVRYACEDVMRRPSIRIMR